MCTMDLAEVTRAHRSQVYVPWGRGLNRPLDEAYGGPKPLRGGDTLLGPLASVTPEQYFLGNYVYSHIFS